MLTIRATDAGFHVLSPLDSELAPNVFLRSFLNYDGTILYDPATGGWVSEESLHYDTIRISLDVASTSTARAGGTVTVTGITYQRMIDGVMQTIGTLDLGAGLALTTYLDNPQGGPQDTLHADLADALQAAVQADGFRFVGGAGNDIFAPDYAVLPIYGPVTLLGRDGDDTLHGGRTDDTIRGGRGDDVLIDEGGTNDIRGGHGDDEIRLGVWSEHSVARGGSGDDLLVSSNGNDKLIGGRGDDVIEGNRGRDILIGGAGDDRLDGGEGNDRLRGGAGDDMLTGGWGADRFIFRADQAGHDRVTDFDDGTDRIVLRFFDGGFEDLDLTRTSDGVLVTWGEDDASILLEGVTADLLDADDFIF